MMNGKDLLMIGGTCIKHSIWHSFIKLFGISPELINYLKS